MSIPIPSVQPRQLIASLNYVCWLAGKQPVLEENRSYDHGEDDHYEVGGNFNSGLHDLYGRGTRVAVKVPLPENTGFPFSFKN